MHGDGIVDWAILGPILVWCVVQAFIFFYYDYKITKSYKEDVRLKKQREEQLLMYGFARQKNDKE